MPDWKDDLVRFLENGDRSGAAAARLGHLPTSVFRYHSTEDWRFQSLRTGVIWLISPTTFNDPYDCFFSRDRLATINAFFRRAIPELRVSLANEGLVASAEEWESVQQSQTILESLRTLLAAHGHEYPSALLCVPVDDEFPDEQERAFTLGVQEHLKVSSFTTRVDSMLMWSHYARQHQGFAVEYEVEAFDGYLASIFYPVSYSEERVTSSRLFECGDQDGDRLCVCLQVALRKAPDWRYEDEWRLVSPSMEEHIEVRMPCPRGIYLGARISTVDEARIRIIRDELTQEHDRQIPLYKMNLSEANYDMIPQLIA